MNVVCLMPTYGRRKSLLEESIRCFARQEYPAKSLLIFDDSGVLEQTTCDVPGVRIMTDRVRNPRIGQRYNRMIARLATLVPEYDAVAVWDDDDIYLPLHLTNHVKILRDYVWSKPSQIVTQYTDPPTVENAAGRFHGSIALRRELAEAPGWEETVRLVYDQDSMKRFHRVAGSPGDPCAFGPPQYTYRWQTSGGTHCSSLRDSDTWYESYVPDNLVPIPSLSLPNPENSDD